MKDCLSMHLLKYHFGSKMKWVIIYRRHKQYWNFGVNVNTQSQCWLLIIATITNFNVLIFFNVLRFVNDYWIFIIGWIVLITMTLSIVAYNHWPFSLSMSMIMSMSWFPSMSMYWDLSMIIDFLLSKYIAPEGQCTVQYSVQVTMASRVAMSQLKEPRVMPFAWVSDPVL